jgi:hypothetical protein
VTRFEVRPKLNMLQGKWGGGASTDLGNQPKHFLHNLVRFTQKYSLLKLDQNKKLQSTKLKNM